ncbi:hypothetical protein HK097_010471 [Rhizophlyctis rosea]|uniref:Poly [ADP-ribose] polymerase n=1 Tax=Rhizophlyctis rosea TaxID=64517 RepID=A0AAD5X8T8_9FUNG|nr:hypothetical protein HK097_010471 [Rhizophlyctis rosea]
MPRTHRTVASSDASGASSSQDPPAANPFDFTASDDDAPPRTPKSKLKNTYKSPARSSLTPRTSRKAASTIEAPPVDSHSGSSDDAPLTTRANAKGKAPARNGGGKTGLRKSLTTNVGRKEAAGRNTAKPLANEDDEEDNDTQNTNDAASSSQSTTNGNTIDSGFASQEVSPRKRPNQVVEVEVIEQRLRPRKVRISDVHEEILLDQDNGNDNEEEEEDDGADDSEEDEESSDDDTMYAEKIMDERTRNGQKSYLIKWDGFSHDADEWVIAPEVDAALITVWETAKGKGKKRSTLKRDETYIDGDELAKMVGEDEDGEEVEVEGKKKRRRSSAGGEGKRKKKKKGSEDEGEGDDEGDAMDLDNGEGEGDDGEPKPKKVKSPRKRTGTTTPKAKKVAAPKKLSKKAQALHDAEQIRLARIAALESKTPPPLPALPSAETTTPDTSCCLLCSARQFSLASTSQNYTLLENCVKETKRMCSPQYGRRPDVPYDSALTEAILKNDLRAIKILKETLTHSHVDAPEQYLKKEGTGYVGGRTFGHRIKTVNESRGNREGNNAFYNYVYVDPFADYVASAVASSSSNQKSRMSPGGDNWVYRSWEYCVRNENVKKEVWEFLVLEWPGGREWVADVGVYECVASGNVELAKELVDLLERSGGFGFNHLHGESLKLKDGESFTSYRKHQILKKATGNASITPLEMACINPSTVALSELYNALTPPETTEPDAWGRLPVHFAAGAKEPTALEWLVEKGVDVRVVDGFKFLPVQVAAKYGRYQNIAILAPKMPSADYTVLKDGYTAIHFASHYGHPKTVQALLDAGANPLHPDKKQKSNALHHAARMGHLPVLETLFNHSTVPAAVDSVDKFGRTPLILAAKNGHYEVVKFLIEKGSDVGKGDSSENTAVHYACGFGWAEVVDLLVTWGGGDVNKGNFWKFSSLMVADLKGHMKIVNQLLANPEVQANFRDKDGLTLLHYCTQTTPQTKYDADRLLQKLKTLLSRGADPKVGNLEEFTPLHLLAEQTDRLASRPERKEVQGEEDDEVEEDEYGTEEERQARREEKERQREYRRRQKEEEENTLYQEDLVELRNGMAEVLIEHGASPTTPSKSGSTPLSLALTNNNHSLVTLFLTSGKIDFTTVTNELILYLGNLAIEADAHIHDVVMTSRWPQIYDGGEGGRKLNAEKRVEFKRVWGVVEGVCRDRIKVMVAHYDDDGYTPVLRIVQQAVEKQREVIDQKVADIDRNNYYYSRAPRLPEPLEVSVDPVFECLIEFLECIIKYAGVESTLDATIKVPKEVLESWEVGKDKLPEPAETGMGALHFVATKQFDTLLQFFITKGANVNIVGGKTPSTPLYAALQKPFTLTHPQPHYNIKDHVKYVGKDPERRWEDCVNGLIAAGADVDQIVGGEDSSFLKIAREDAGPEDASHDSESPASRYNRAVRRVLTLMVEKTSREGANLSFKDGVTPVMYFAKRGDVEMCQKIVQKGADLTRVAKDGKGVGHLAVRAPKNVLEIVKAVSATQVDLQDTEGDTALMVAARNGLKDVCLEILKSAQRQGRMAELVGVINKQKETVLMIAASKGEVEVVEQAAKGGADLEVRGLNGTNALLEAVKAKSLGAVKVLVEKKANVNVRDDSENWAIHYAVANDDPKVVKLLLESGAQPNVVDKYGSTPLHHAIQASKHAINTSLRFERLLINHGAPINALDHQNRSPLHITFIDVRMIPYMHIAVEEKKKHEKYQKKIDAERRAEQRTKAIVEKFKLHSGDTKAEEWLAAADVEVAKRKSEKALKEVGDIIDERSEGLEWHTGRWEDDGEIGKVKGDPIEVLSWLVELPAIQLDSKDKFGRTPLHYAARLGAFTSSSYLLERGANIEGADGDGNTPLQVALLYRHIDFAVMLANRGAEVLQEVTQPDGSKLSNFKYSLSHKFMSLAYLIMEKGQELMNAVHDALCTGKYHLAVLLISKSSREIRACHHPETQQTLLHIAADFLPSDPVAWEEYSLEIAELLAEAGLDQDVWQVDAHGRTALHYAAKYGHVALVKWLLERSRRDQYRVDEDGRSVVGYALESKVVDVIQAVLDANLDVCGDDNTRKTSVVRRAVEVGRKEILQTLLARAATPNGDVGIRVTALCLAIRKEEYELADLLIKAGANVDDGSKIKWKDEKTGTEEMIVLPALFQALGKKVKAGNATTPLIELLLAAGAKPDLVHPKTQKTPLHLAIERSDLAEVKSLVQHGADVNLIPAVTSDWPDNKRSAFQIAFFGQKSDLLKTLMKGNPNVSQRDKITGLTLLDYALSTGDLELVKRLLTLKADVNVRSLPEVEPLQRTSLMRCAVTNNPEAFTLILNHTNPADLNTTDVNGKTVVHYVVSPRDTASFENVQLLKLIVNAGADVELADGDGKKPIYYAWKQWSKKMYKALLELGAADLSEEEKADNISSDQVDRMDIDGEAPAADGEAMDVDIDINGDADKARDELLEEEAAQARREREILARSREMTVAQLDEEDKLESVPVDPLMKLGADVANVVRVVHDDGEEEVYDLLMTRTDVDKGMWGVNLQYKMQVVHNRIQDLYILWTRWGAVGEDGMFQKTPYSTKEECIQEFEKIFKSKTGNAWKERDTSFVPKPGKYIPLKLSPRKNVNIKPIDSKLLSTTPPSNLPHQVQDFMKIITDVPTINRAVNDADVGLPLGNLEPAIIKEAYEVLHEIRDKVKELEEERTKTLVPDVNALKTLKTALVDLSNRYYGLVPAKHDPRSGIQPILKVDQLNKEMIKMTELMYLDTSSTLLLAAYARRQTLNPLDYVSKAIACNLTPIPNHPTSDEFALIDEYTHTTYDAGYSYRDDYDIVSVFRAERAGEKERFSPFKQTDGRKLLWHGSRTSNFMGILRQGLRIAPIEAPVSGYMFGKGIYFADTFSKSINYSGGDGYACLLLCEVAVGKSYEREEAEYMEKAPDGFDSTKGLGQWEPSGEVVVCEDGVKVPRYPLARGRLRKDDKGKDLERGLQHNEFIVYDAARARIRYVVLVRNKRYCFLCKQTGQPSSFKTMRNHADRYGENKNEKSDDDDEKTVVGEIPTTALEGNTTEIGVAKGVLFASGRTVRDIWEEGVGKVIESKSYVKHWQPVTSLTNDSPICGSCADTILSDLLYDVVKQAKQDGVLPETLAKRPDCWWGSNCRTQKSNPQHAERYNHVCEQTKKADGEDKAADGEEADEFESLPSDYSEEDETCSNDSD